MCRRNQHSTYIFAPHLIGIQSLLFAESKKIQRKIILLFFVLFCERMTDLRRREMWEQIGVEKNIRKSIAPYIFDSFVCMWALFIHIIPYHIRRFAHFLWHMNACQLDIKQQQWNKYSIRLWQISDETYNIKQICGRTRSNAHHRLWTKWEK